MTSMVKSRKPSVRTSVGGFCEEIGGSPITMRASYTSRANRQLGEIFGNASVSDERVCQDSGSIAATLDGKRQTFTCILPP
jgi:hypothetical protein